MVSRLSNSKNVRRDLISSFQTIDTNSTFGVDGKSFVWIDGNAKESRIGVNQFILVPHDGVPQYTCIV